MAKKSSKKIPNFSATNFQYGHKEFIMDGVRFRSIRAQDFLKEEVPELYEQLQFWKGELGECEMGKTKVGKLCKIKTPFSYFQISLLSSDKYDWRFSGRHTRNMTDPQFFEYMAKHAKGNGQTVANFHEQRNYGHIRIKIWHPGMGFHLSARFENKDFSGNFEDLDSCFLRVCDETEKMWEEISSKVPFYISAATSFREKQNVERARLQGTSE